MSILKSYVDAPKFYDGTPFSATDYNILARNMELLKGAAKRPEPIHFMNRIIQVPNTGYVWRGGFQYRIGMTDARFIYYSAQLSGAGIGTFKIFFDSVEVYSAATNIGGYSTIDISIDDKGYVDNQIITVEIIQYDSGGSNVFKNQVFLLDAFCFPLDNVMTTAWDGVPSFGSLNATNLNQLSNAEDWLAERIAIVPIPAAMATLYWQGLNQTTPATILEYFTVRATNDNPRLRGFILYYCNVASGKIRVTIDTHDTDYGPFAAGTINLIDIDIDIINTLGLAVNTDYGALIEEVVVTANGTDPTMRSRISTNFLYMDAASYSLIDDSSPDTTYLYITQLLSLSALRILLNNISDQALTVYSIVTGEDRVFNRAHMFRGRYGYTKEQNEFYKDNLIAAMKRQGEILWVKGQGLKIGYGPLTVTVTEDKKWEWKFEREEDLTSGDKVEQRYFYLDQFQGLTPGQYYYIFGTDIIYAAEYMR